MAIQEATHSSERITHVRLGRLRPNKLRLRVEDREIGALEESIARLGLLHPIVARRSEGGAGLEVISGHRRLEALRRIGADSIPCKVLDVSDKESFELALAENLQRRALDPAEEAMAFRQYVDVYKWGARRTLAKKVGKSEEYIAHRMRLLELPGDVLAKVGKELSPSQGEELAWVGDPEATRRLEALATEQHLTVKELHELARVEKESKPKCGREGRRRGGVPVDEYQSLRNDQEDESDVDQIIRTSEVALRYVMSYLDSCAGTVEKTKYSGFRSFLVNERYKVHQVLDDFVSAQVKVSRAMRRNADLPTFS
ncbi:MAG: ParB/RepB/Spo0J family partition protein [Thaumarchaeota archaeon]|nr:ParB/RepB/Spo0J family partition protein [Nitrososphaerota archaeon]